ncbi:hypothetical protein CerSpe_024920 [Prunus speciosa]
MFKARYFQEYDFLHAHGGSTPSFTWKSILWGRELFSRSLQWRIGDGRLVKIYIDQWVPHHLTFNVQSSPCLLVDSRASALITASGHWNVFEIYSLFTFLEAELILSIPLSCDTGDCRIWHFTRNSRYTVKSGYWYALEFQAQMASLSVSESSSSSSQQLWKHLWKLKFL